MLRLVWKCFSGSVYVHSNAGVPESVVCSIGIFSVKHLKLEVLKEV